MADQYIDTPQKLQHNLSYWKQRSFLDGYIPLDRAVSTIGTPGRLVEARQDYAARWVLSSTTGRGTTPAVFYTAAVWRWGSHPETGNFVPPGEMAPERLAESRVQSAPSSLCQLSYALDTSRDATLWEAQKAFETYILTLPGFNKSKKQRRTWQDGTDEKASAYVMSAQMFFKRTKFTAKKEAKRQYSLHPWIEMASKTTPYFPNPDRPMFFEPSQGVLVNMADCNPSHIRTGDLVWISFFVEFIIGINNWSTTFTPYDIVRVGSVSPDLIGDGQGMSEDNEDCRPRLVAGQQIRIDLVGDVQPDLTAAVPPTLTETPVAVTQPEELTAVVPHPDDATPSETQLQVGSHTMQDAGLINTADVVAAEVTNVVNFGPSDARGPWDGLIEFSPSPSPPSWPAETAKLDDDFDLYMQSLDDDTLDEDWLMCDAPSGPHATTPFCHPSTSAAEQAIPSPPVSPTSTMRSATPPSDSSSSSTRSKKRLIDDVAVDEEELAKRFTGRVTRSRTIAARDYEL